MVLEAADRIAKGMPAAQIAKEVQELTSRCHASFVIDTLEFLYKGGPLLRAGYVGRQYAQAQALHRGQQRRRLHERGKKYRGSLDKALEQYVHDKLDGRTDLDNRRIFITHSGISDERVELVRRMVKKLADFQEIYITRAGCTISTHCGPNTLGILFMTRT